MNQYFGLVFGVALVVAIVAFLYRKRKDVSGSGGTAAPGSGKNNSDKV